MQDFIDKWGSELYEFVDFIEHHICDEHRAEMVSILSRLTHIPPSTCERIIKDYYSI